jgi:signal transduction histidine kinase
MLTSQSSPKPRWSFSLVEVITIVAFTILTVGGLIVSLQDAVQLGRAINLNLTQTITVNQGIVNLQREVNLTRIEVLRLLGRLGGPAGSITRFAFVQIQVKNLIAETESPSIKLIFTNEDISLAEDIKAQSDSVEELLTKWQQSNDPQEATTFLFALDAQLEAMETSIKKLVDRQATTQRDEIIQTRNSLSISQHTTLLAGAVLLLLGAALAVVYRRTLNLRLQQAVESDRLKSQLLANVSHELRTPITAIQGYSQLLNDETYGSLSDKQKSTMRRILINTTQLKGMVNNLLDRAQMEQGKLSLRNEPFAPEELLDTAKSALNILVGAKNVVLTGEISAEVPAELVGDVLRLQQILFNLVSNAIKFTEDGSVRMRIFLPDKQHWALQVADTGIGIPADAQAHIFSAFWQIDSSATREYRGSGLGLSIVKELAGLMDANITLASEPEKGSTFTILFPREART